MRYERAFLILTAVVAAASPYFGMPGWSPSLATVAALVAISLIGLNLIFGYCGMLALGQAGFAAIPAYISGILVMRGVPVFIAALIGFGLTVFIARVLAEIFIRLPGIYLAVGTLGFAYVVEGIARAFPSVTGGASGLVLTLPFVLTENQWYAVAILALAVAIVSTLYVLRGSAARTLQLVRHDELAAAVAGIDVVKLKVKVFSIGAAYSAAGGLMLAYYTSVVTPGMGGANTSLEYLAMVVIGGAGSIAGPVIGAAVIDWLFSVAGAAAARYELLVYGSCFLAIILLAPGGLAALFHKLPWPRRPVAAAAAADDAIETAPTHVVTGSGLRALNVSKRFGGLHVVRNVNLNVARGEIVAVLGPNGAGKTTFFNILSGIEQADDGDITLDDNPISNQSIHTRATAIGRSFQVPRLVLEMTVLQNVLVRVDQLYPALSEPIRVDIALSELGRFGLTELASTKVGEVAVGHHKLIDIARAAVGSPALLLLDEPAVGLTEKELDALKEIIWSLTKSGAAVLIVDHNVEFITTIADRILVMEGGKALALGAPREVLSSASVRAAYLGVLA